MDKNIFYAGGQAFAQQPTWELQDPDRKGFDRQGDPYEEKGIDLNEQLVKNRPATFFLRVNSDAMSGAGIQKGDVVIVDRSLEPRNNKIVIAVVDGEMLIRKLELQPHKVRLNAIGHKLATIELDPSVFRCWGVVTYVIRCM
ncbi:MAG TPA: translesion error-prone DNA polymerase V autoproteolytic subunit [Flavisolibacter sp.]|jgi:DNA polymerase V|nr:translesion error-prone DNA polymerase V autoproteolytic subunit [Flavisolibacter sp.]